MDSSHPGDDPEQGLPLRTRTPGITALSSYVDSDRWSVYVQGNSPDEPYDARVQSSLQWDGSFSVEPRKNDGPEPWSPLQASELSRGQVPLRQTGLAESLRGANSSVYYSAQSGCHSIFFSAPSEAGGLHKERMQRLRK